MRDILITIFRKLSSRKLWMSIAVIATGISVSLGNDATEIQTVAGSVTALIGGVAYIVTEGKIDAAHIGDIAENVETVKDSIDKVD